MSIKIERALSLTAQTEPAYLRSNTGETRGEGREDDKRAKETERDKGEGQGDKWGTQRNNKGTTKEQQRNNKGTTKEQQRNNKGTTKEQQGDKGGTRGQGGKRQRGNADQRCDRVGGPGSKGTRR